MLDEISELGPENILLDNYPMSNRALYAGKFHVCKKLRRMDAHNPSCSCAHCLPTPSRPLPPGKMGASAPKIARAPFPFVSESDILSDLLCYSPATPVVGRLFMKAEQFVRL
jgi:hypothetical protein